MSEKNPHENGRMTVAQCLSLKPQRNYTFVAYQICNFRSIEPVIFTLEENFGGGGRRAYPGVKIVAPLAKDQGVLKYYWNRLRLKKLGMASLFSRAIARMNIRLMHCHFGPQALLFKGVAETFDLGMITSFYGYDISSHLSRQDYALPLRWLFERGDLFLVEGSAAARRLVTLGCKRSKIMIHRIGVDLSRLPYVPRMKRAEPTKILMCGSFVEKKGITDGINAFAPLARQHDVRLVIVGDGPLRSKIERVTRETGVGTKVILLGTLDHDHYIEVMKKCQILLAPSKTASNGDTEGGAPTVIIEALATGMPVVSTFHADIPEIAHNGAAALLTTEGNVRGLTENLEFLLEHPLLWKIMGARGRAHVEKWHNAEIQNRKLEQVYRDVIWLREQPSRSVQARAA